MTTQTLTFNIGDIVDVLHAARLPQEHIIATGAIERITYQTSDGTPLYWIAGVKCARTDRVLRIAQKPAIERANELIAFLVNALDVAQRSDNLEYVRGAAEYAINEANRRRVRNANGYLEVR
jgi:hypothetical protein